MKKLLLLISVLLVQTLVHAINERNEVIVVWGAEKSPDEPAIAYYTLLDPEDLYSPLNEDRLYSLHTYEAAVQYATEHGWTVINTPPNVAEMPK